MEERRETRKTGKPGKELGCLKVRRESSGSVFKKRRVERGLLWIGAAIVILPKVMCSRWAGRKLTTSEDASMKVIGNEGTLIGASKVNDASQ